MTTKANRPGIQSVYFEHVTFAVFTAACYIKGSLSVVHDLNMTVGKDTGLNVITVAIISSQALHKKNIAFCFNNQVIDFVKIYQPEITKLQWWNGRCCG